MVNKKKAGYLDRFSGLSVSKWNFIVIIMAMSGAGLGVYELSFFNSLKFFFGVFVLFYIPGSLIIRPCSLQAVNRFTRPILALGAGTVVVPVFYRLLRYMNYSDSFIVGVFALCLAAWLHLVIRDFRIQKHQFQLQSVDVFSVMALLVFILVLLHISHFTDVKLAADGFQFRATDMTESVFHLGLINNMADTFPPTAVYASGSADYSHYHLNMHLQADLVIRLLGLEALHLVSFYLPLLYFTLIVLLPYVFVRECGGTALTGIVCGMLVFGADFSFIPATVLSTRPGFAWTAFFQSTIWSLFTLNGFLPSVIALFMCISVLHDYFRKDNRANLVLFSLLAYGAFGLKSSMGLQIAAVALATGLVMVFFGSQQKKGWMLTLVSALTLAVMFLDLTILRSGVGGSVISISPLNNFQNVLSNMRMSELSVIWYPPMILLVLLAGLGVRAFGLLYLTNGVNTDNPKDWSIVYIVIFLFSGFFVSEMLFIGTDPLINNGTWFYIQSLTATWFLLFLFLIKMQGRKNLYFVSLLAVIALSIPSTVQFLQLRTSDNYLDFDQNDLIIIKYLRETDPKSVVLHPLNRDRPSLASNFAGRATVLSVFLSFISEIEGLSERARSVQLFFDKKTENSRRLEVLDKYQVDYIYGATSELSFMENLPNTELEVQSGDLVLYRVYRHQRT